MLERCASFPATAFYDADGELVYTRQGPYEDERGARRADIERATAGPSMADNPAYAPAPARCCLA